MGKMNHATRASKTGNKLTQSLLSIIQRKKSNLCVAVDVTTTSSLLNIIQAIGPYICLLKLHIDILSDFTPSLIPKLLALKNEFDFLIFEDRKFADIGSTVVSQYIHGIYRIVEWADLVTVHSVPGPGIITGLASAASSFASSSSTNTITNTHSTDTETSLAKTMAISSDDRKERGILLLAEMSSSGNLCSESYSRETIEMASNHADFVVGFIAQARQTKMSDGMLVLMPGVSMGQKGDGLGQQYATPEDAVKRGADVIIVGRGVYGADDVAKEAKRYQEAGWEAYLATVT